MAEPLKPPAMPQAIVPPVFRTNTSIKVAGKKAKIEEVQVFGEDGSALDMAHFFAEHAGEGEISITLSDHMPAGMYFVYTGKKRALARVRKE